MNDSPATKEDLKELERDLKQFILEREVQSIRWFVGTQIAYFAITLSAVWFMIQPPRAFMKNGTHPLYALLRDPKQIATNGSANKHAFSLRKIILVSGIIAIALGVGIWQLREYQKSERREQFITWVAKYRPGWSSSMIKAQWEKIQYAREHTDIVAPVAASHGMVTVPAAPIPVSQPLAPPPGRTTALGLTPEEYRAKYGTR